MRVRFFCAVVLSVQLLASYILHAPFLKPVDHYAVEVVPDDVGERLSRGSQAGSQQVFPKRQHQMGCLIVPSSVLRNNPTADRAAERLGTRANAAPCGLRRVLLAAQPGR